MFQIVKGKHSGSRALVLGALLGAIPTPNVSQETLTDLPGPLDMGQSFASW